MGRSGAIAVLPPHSRADGCAPPRAVRSPRCFTTHMALTTTRPARRRCGARHMQCSMGHAVPAGGNRAGTVLRGPAVAHHVAPACSRAGKDPCRTVSPPCRAPLSAPAPTHHPPTTHPPTHTSLRQALGDFSNTFFTGNGEHARSLISARAAAQPPPCIAREPARPHASLCQAASMRARVPTHPSHGSSPDPTHSSLKPSRAAPAAAPMEEDAPGASADDDGPDPSEMRERANAEKEGTPINVSGAGVGGLWGVGAEGTFRSVEFRRVP